MDVIFRVITLISSVTWFIWPFVFVGSLLGAIEEIHNGKRYTLQIFLGGIALLFMLSPLMQIIFTI